MGKWQTLPDMACASPGLAGVITWPVPDGGGLRSGPEFNVAVHVAEGVVDTRNNRSQPCV